MSVNRGVCWVGQALTGNPLQVDEPVLCDKRYSASVPLPSTSTYSKLQHRIQSTAAHLYYGTGNCMGQHDASSRRMSWYCLTRAWVDTRFETSEVGSLWWLNG